MLIQQLLREWPPGYGGVERVAHELGNRWGGVIFSLDVQGQSLLHQDSLPVKYSRRRLRSFAVIGRFHLPLPSRSLLSLLTSPEPLHGHLPSPAVLLLLVLSRLLRPRRIVSAHWHSFLEKTSGLNGYLYGLYQWIAIRILPYMSGVVTTSAVLSAELERCGCSPTKLCVLPCCLSSSQEEAALAIPLPLVQQANLIRVLFIGRLDSYKRLDWLLDSLAVMRTPWRLSVVGDGPNRIRFERLARQLFLDQLRSDPHLVRFHGCLNEIDKQAQIANSDVLVLPSDRSNEAFGIVQLEAMAAGRIALAFDQPRSGMGWVGRLPGLSWSQTPDGLGEVLQRLADQPALRQQLSAQSRERYCRLFARRVWLKQLEQLGYPLGNGRVSFSTD